MKTLLCSMLIFSFYIVISSPQNLIILVDSAHQEGLKQDDITATHQLVTALQQKSAPILVSISLWKNFQDRKQDFKKKLLHRSSLESCIYDLYHVTNQQIAQHDYNLGIVNHSLSESWYKEHYPMLSGLSSDQLKQLKFNFLCYYTVFSLDHWKIFDAHQGMLLLIPHENHMIVDDVYRVYNLDHLTHDTAQEKTVTDNFKKLLGKNLDQWIIYVTGHGTIKNITDQAYIAGIKISDFLEFLSYLHKEMDIKLLVYSSCYAGGIHTIEPYQGILLHYPIIVISLTDAPIYSFGFFEGMKLPPYHEHYYLTSFDVDINKGLVFVPVQNFTQFFRYAWTGNYDLNLVGHVSQFFNCSQYDYCKVKNIENLPLMRKAQSNYFHIIDDETTHRLVNPIFQDQSMFVSKPVLLYVHKVQRLEMKKPVPLISMLPGLQNHEITELIAHDISFSTIIYNCFLSLIDAEKNKNFIIKHLYCHNDIVTTETSSSIADCMILQQGFIPQFVSKNVDACVVCKINQSYYLITIDKLTIDSIIKLDESQTAVVQNLQLLMNYILQQNQSDTYQSLITFDTYMQHKLYQQEILDICLDYKICKT